MKKMSILFWYFWMSILIEKIHLSEGEVVEKWFAQIQDHFDVNNRYMWWMRYYENNEFFHKNGPMFIMIGGEQTITPDDIQTGFMFEMADIHGAIMYYIEHRYYGASRPVPDTTLENLKYLSIGQVLADIAFFIIKKKEELGNSDIDVILIGGSYAGNLAAWMRIKYPKLVHAAVAVSAPIYVTAEFPQYFEEVADSLRKYDENCVTAIEKAFSELEEVITDPVSNSIKLKNDFNLCNEPDLSESREIALMVSSFAQVIAKVVVQNSIESNERTLIADLCIRMMENNDNTSPYHRLAGIISGEHSNNFSCLEMDYNKIAQFHAETCWSSPGTNSRIWNYQSCTELGYKQTFSSPKSIFGSRVTFQFFMEICRDIFGENFNSNVLNDNIERINLIYNSELSNATNIIFINGDIDPWRALSVLHDLNDNSPSILIPGTSHCEFLRLTGKTISSAISQARCNIGWILSDLIETFN